MVFKEETTRLVQLWSRTTWYGAFQNIKVEAEQIDFIKHESRCEIALRVNLDIWINGKKEYHAEIIKPMVKGTQGLQFQVFSHLIESLPSEIRGWRPILEKFLRRCAEKSK